MKKVLSLALALMMIVSAFAVFSVSSSAAEPKQLTLTPKWDQIENFGTDGTVFIIGVSVPVAEGQNQATETEKFLKAYAEKGEYVMSVAVTDVTAGKTYFIDGYKMLKASNVSGEWYAQKGLNFLRIAVTNYGIPLDLTHKYDVTLYFFKGQDLVFKGATTGGAVNKHKAGITVKAPAKVPFKHTVMEQAPVAPKAPVIDDSKITIAPFKYGAVNGWENWGKPQRTQLLITIPGDAKGRFNSGDYTWKITIFDGAKEKTIVSKLSSAGGYFNGAYIYRFIPCDLLGNNQFVPEANKDYAVKVEISKGGKVVATSEKVSGFKTDAAFKPIVPAEPVLAIEPYKGGSLHGFENWAPSADAEKQTNLLVLVTNSAEKLSGAEYSWKFTFKAGETTKVVNLKCTSVGTVGGNYMYRFQPCVEAEANRFVPVVGTDYTVQVEVTKGGVLFAKSAEVAGFSTAVAPIVPTTPPTPPVTGDATVYVAVLAVVALFGTAVVVTKKVLA